MQSTLMSHLHAWVQQTSSSRWRWPLTLALALPFAAAGTLIVMILLGAHQRTVQALITEKTHHLLESNAEQIRGRLRQYMDQAFDMHLLMADAIVSRDAVDRGDLQAVETYMGGVFHNVYLPHHPNITNLQLGTAKGEFLGFKRTPDGDMSTMVKDRRTQDRLVIYKPGRQEIDQVIDRYNPVTRPWYVPAATSGRPLWSPPYTSLVQWESRIIISATAPVFDRQGQLYGVLSADLSLDGMVQYIQQVPLREQYPSSLLYIMDEQGHIILDSFGGARIAQEVQGGGRTLALAKQHGNALVRASVSAIDSVKGQALVPFTHDGQRFLAHATSFRDPRGLSWTLVSMVASEEVEGDARAQSQRSLWLALGVGVVCILGGVLLIRRISVPLQQAAARALHFTKTLVASPVNDVRSNILEISVLVSTFNRMAERIQAQLGRLHELAMFDRVTGLMNKHGVTSDMQWVGTQRLTLTLVRVRDFGQIQAMVGLQTAEKLLRHIGQRLRPHGPAVGARLAHLGGETFFFLQDEDHPDFDLACWLDQVAADLGRPFETATDEVTLTFNMGSAQADVQLDEFESRLLREASIALEAAADAGPDQRMLFDPSMLARSAKRAQLVSDLSAALHRRELFVVFQSIVDTETGHLHGLEALVRWRHPQRGLVSPGEFIPVAESTGQIVAIGDFVLNDACTQVAHWMQRHGTPSNFKLHVNVSVRQFIQTDFVQQVSRALQHSGLPRGVLTVEMTESLLMEPTPALRATLEELHTLGVDITLDDFGTGYSSLSYLNKLKFDTLKIDRSFVVAAETSTASQAVLKAVADIAASLRVDCVAEGVETQDQVELVRRVGVRYVQGFFFSRPGPLDEVRLDCGALASAA